MIECGDALVGDGGHLCGRPLPRLQATGASPRCPRGIECRQWEKARSRAAGVHCDCAPVSPLDNDVDAPVRLPLKVLPGPPLLRLAWKPSVNLLVRL